MTNTTKKITKSQRNEDIILMLQNQPVKYGTTVQEAIDHLIHENELLSNKNKTKDGSSKKLTKAQEINEQYKNDIRSFLLDNPARLITANEVMTELFMSKYPDIPWSNQKTASLLNAIADKYDKDGVLTDDSGDLEKFPGKGKNKTTFRIKQTYVDSFMEEEEEEENV